MSELEEALSRIAELENWQSMHREARKISAQEYHRQREEIEQLQSQLKVAEAKFAKSVEFIEVILDEISLNIRPKKPTDEEDFKKMFNWIKSELASITADTLSSIGEKK